jgi:hypothetical protein
MTMLYLFLALALAGLLWVLVHGVAVRKPQAHLSDGLLYGNKQFELAVNQDAETLTLRATHAVHRTPSMTSDEPPQTVDLTFPAAGFSVAIERNLRAVKPASPPRSEPAQAVYSLSPAKSRPVVPAAAAGGYREPTGFSTVTVMSRRHPLAPEGTALAGEVDCVEIRQIPDAEADIFRACLTEVQEWVSQIESELRDRVTAQAAARRLARSKAEQTMESLGRSCDFQPTHSDMDFGAEGEILWAIKLNSDGRCWIHAEGKTFQGPLAGGKATVVADGLLVMVRDSRWETTYFSRRKMKLFAGASRATVEAWCQRINALTGASNPR